MLGLQCCCCGKWDTPEEFKDLWYIDSLWTCKECTKKQIESYRKYKESGRRRMKKTYEVQLSFSSASYLTVVTAEDADQAKDRACEELKGVKGYLDFDLIDEDVWEVEE